MSCLSKIVYSIVYDKFWVLNNIYPHIDIIIQYLLSQGSATYGKHFWPVMCFLAKNQLMQKKQV